ncbi:hypothetical protein KI387_022933, partial [Taxus chinensis]
IIVSSGIGELKKLKILNLSSNNLSGFIPNKIVSLQAMTITTENGIMVNENYDSVSYPVDYFGLYYDELDMIIKGINQHYPYIISTMRLIDLCNNKLSGIDLSNNKLSGDVPSDFRKLKGLRFLNLSMNNLNGTIPISLGKMNQLESLDLSKNRFSGIIPWQLQSLSYVASLNLSMNNLSGGIPQ